MNRHSIAIFGSALLALMLLTSSAFASSNADNDHYPRQRTQKKASLEEPTIGPIGVYYTNWARYRQCSIAPPFKPEQGAVDAIADKLDFIVYAFGTFSTSDCVVKMFDPWSDENSFPALMALKQRNPRLKILLSIGGWNFGSRTFSDMARNPSCRATFVQTGLAFLRLHGFDGLDIDWEYPNSAPEFRGDRMDQGGAPDDAANFEVLLQETLAAFRAESQQQNRQRLLLTVAVPAGTSHILNYPSTFYQYIDMVQLMTFDFNGAWQETVYSHTPIRADPIPGISDSSIETAIDKYLELGVPANKMRLGMGFYGRGWTLQNPTDSAPGSLARACQSGCGQWADCGTYVCQEFQGQCTKVAGFMSYFEIKHLLASGAYTEKFDPVSQTMYAYDGAGHWLTYDNLDTYKLKVDYAQQRGLGGMWAWALDYDTYYTQPSYEILNNVQSRWFASTGLPETTQIAPPPPSTTGSVQQPSTTSAIPQTTSATTSVTTSNIPSTTGSISINRIQLCPTGVYGFKTCLSWSVSIECDQQGAWMVSCPSGSSCSPNGGSDGKGGCSVTTTQQLDSLPQTTAASVSTTGSSVAQPSTTAVPQTPTSSGCASGTWGPNCQCTEQNLGRFFCADETHWFLCNYENIPIPLTSCPGGLVCSTQISQCDYPSQSTPASTTAVPIVPSTTANNAPQTTSVPTAPQTTAAVSQNPATTAQSSGGNPIPSPLELIGYWGQSDLVHNPPLDSPDFDVYSQINIGFVHRFLPSVQCQSKGKTIKYLGVNFAGYCTELMFNNCPDLFTCPTIANHIHYRQSRGQRILISIGGSAGTYRGPANTQEAQELALNLWDMFLGGSSETRPFGDAVLDGVDLDMETGISTYWADFVIALRALMDAGPVVPPGGRYYITGSPQCPYPEPFWGSASNPSSILGNAAASQAIDLLSVQFYPNQGGCQITASGFQSNFQSWADWAVTKGKPDTRVFVGVPAASGAAGAGYLTTPQLATKLELVSSNPRFGGVMLWNLEFAKYNTDEDFDSNLNTLLANL